MSKFDYLLESEELNIIKEGVPEGHGSLIKKEEIINLYEKDKSMCRILF